MFRSIRSWGSSGAGDREGKWNETIKISKSLSKSKSKHLFVKFIVPSDFCSCFVICFLMNSSSRRKFCQMTTATMILGFGLGMLFVGSWTWPVSYIYSKFKWAKNVLTLKLHQFVSMFFLLISSLKFNIEVLDSFLLFSFPKIITFCIRSVQNYFKYITFLLL